MHGVAGGEGGQRVRSRLGGGESGEEESVLAAAGDTVEAGAAIAERMGAQAPQGGLGALDRHGGNVAGMPGLAADGIAVRVGEEAVQGQQVCGGVGPAGGGALAAMEQHDGGGRPGAGGGVEAAEAGDIVGFGVMERVRHGGSWKRHLSVTLRDWQRGQAQAATKTDVIYDGLGGTEKGGDSFATGGTVMLDRVVKTAAGTLKSVVLTVKLAKADLGSFRVVGALVGSGGLPGGG